MNNFLLTLAAIIVVVLAALFAVPPFIDWNAYRGTFEEEVSRLLDREVRVQGRVSVSVLPVPYVSFEKVRIADQTGIAGSVVRAEQFKMWLSVPPLLRGVIEARQVELEKPVLRVRMLEDGTGNWQSLQIKESNLAFLPNDVALNSVIIDDGTVVFEHHTGEEITRISKLSGELSGAALRGPYKFVGTAEADEATQEIRVSTAPLEADGNIRFRGAVRDEMAGLSHTIDGTLIEPLGRSRIEGRLRTRSEKTLRAPDGSSASAFELTSKVYLDGEALRLDDIAVTFQNRDRLQTLTGSALTSWQDGLVTRTRLKAPWLDLDAVAGTGPGDSPLTALQRLITRGLQPLGAGVTSAALDIKQGRLAGATISDLEARVVRRDGVTKVEELRVTLPGLTALVLDGFVDTHDKGLQFDGNAVLRTADLHEFARWLAPGSAEVTKSLSGAVALNGTLRVRPNEIAISNAHADIAGERLEGSLAYDATAARPRLTANLEAATFDLSRLAPDLLDPGVLAAKLGFTEVGAIPETAVEAARVFRGLDLTLKLRAEHLSDGRRTFNDVHADLDRIADRLTIRRLDVDWQPGVKLALSGDLDDLGRAAAGQLQATVAADGDTAATRLAQFFSRILGENVPANLLVARAPFRLAVDATLAGGDVAPADPDYPTVIVADGTTSTGRLRLTARTAGPLSGWRDQAAHLDARLHGPRALDVARWLIGTGSGASEAAAAKPSAAGSTIPQTPPATVLLSLVGKPMTRMQAVARFGAGQMLAADFSGTVQLRPGSPLAARWSGDLTFAEADTRVLSELLWPRLQDRVAAAPVRGRVALAGGEGELVIEPKRLQVAASRLTGSLKLSPERALSGTLGVSKARLGDLAALILASGPDGAAQTGALRSGPATRDETQTPLPWPRQRFDFSHFADLSADLALTIERLNVTDRQMLARDVMARVKLSGGRVALSGLEARLSEGSVTGTAQLTRTPAGTVLTARIGGSALPLTLISPSLETGRRLSGRAELTAALSGRALSPDALASDLKGSGKLHLADARVPGLSGKALTELARKVLAGELEPDALGHELAALSQGMAIELGAPTLDFTIRNGIVNLPTIVVADAVGETRNTTVLNLRDWRFDSRWTVRPAALPKPETVDQTLTLPPVTLVYAGTLGKLSQMKRVFNVGDLEREIVVARMEANVARLERLRREDEERARQEAERRRVREENERLAREAERLRIERERAEGLRGNAPTQLDQGWQSRVKPEPRPPAEDINRPQRQPRPL